MEKKIFNLGLAMPWWIRVPGVFLFLTVMAFLLHVYFPKDKFFVSASSIGNLICSGWMLYILIRMIWMHNETIAEKDAQILRRNNIILRQALELEGWRNEFIKKNQS